MDDVTSDGSPDYLGSFGSFLNAGASAYKTIAGAKLTEKAAGTADPTKTLTTSTATPIYKQVWFIPACIVTGLLLVFGLSRR